jgi:pilus assembly protein FimV
VGLGGINVKTALGQRLKADIELVAVDNADKSRLVARLAPSSAYKNSGLEYPYGNNFKFEIESRENGGLYIKVSSAQPINDPFVSLLVELSWPSGKLSREYTFLLDPPGYMPDQPAQAGVQAVAPESETKGSTLPEVAPSPAPSAELESAPVTLVPPKPSTEQVVPAETTAQPAGQAGSEKTATDHAQQAVPETATGEPMKQEAPVTTSALPEESAAQPKENAEWISVNRGDTLYKLAEQYKLEDMNLERLLVALYRVNAKEFDGNNMNRIRAGKVLKLPVKGDYDSVTLDEAKSEIRAQAADWNAYRQKLAGVASASNQTQTVQQVVTGKINSSVADRTPIAKESAKEVLKLSKGEALGDQVGAGGKSAQELKNAAQEEAIAKDKAAKEEQMRLAKLEDIRQKEEKLAQLKAQAQPQVQQPAQPQAQKPTISAPVAATAKKTTEEPIAKSKPKVVKPEPSLTDQIMEDPIYLAGGAGAILVLGGVGFVLFKRKKKAADENIEDEDVGEIRSEEHTSELQSLS